MTQTSSKTRQELDKITEQIIGAAIKVHNQLGPGFVEKIYEKAVAHEFQKNNINFLEQAEIKVDYDGKKIGYQRVDFVVENAVIVELKAVSEIGSIHEAQLLSYLKTVNLRVGLILNFAEKRLNIKRLVNKY